MEVLCYKKRHVESWKKEEGGDTPSNISCPLSREFAELDYGVGSPLDVPCSSRFVDIDDKHKAKSSIFLVWSREIPFRYLNLLTLLFSCFHLLGSISRSPWAFTPNLHQHLTAILFYSARIHAQVHTWDTAERGDRRKREKESGGRPALDRWQNPEERDFGCSSRRHEGHPQREERPGLSPKRFPSTDLLGLN